MKNKSFEDSSGWLGMQRDNKDNLVNFHLFFTFVFWPWNEYPSFFNMAECDIIVYTTFRLNSYKKVMPFIFHFFLCSISRNTPEKNVLFNFSTFAVITVLKGLDPYITYKHLSVHHITNIKPSIVLDIFHLRQSLNHVINGL